VSLVSSPAHTRSQIAAATSPSSGSAGLVPAAEPEPLSPEPLSPAEPGEQARDPVAEHAEEHRAASAEHLEHGLVQRRHAHLARLGQQQRGAVGGREHQPAVAAGQRARAGPDDLAGRGELVEQGGGVAGHPPGQDQRLQRGRRHRRPGQPLHHLEDRARVGPPPRSAPPPDRCPGPRPRSRARSRARRAGTWPAPPAAPARPPCAAGPGSGGAAGAAPPRRTIRSRWPQRRTAVPGGQELALDHAPVGREPPQRHRHHGDAEPVPPGQRRP
jgi:hypothetical protein